MKINDLGFLLGSRDHLENMKILTVFSLSNGVINGVFRQRKNNNFVIILDKIKFEWSSRNKDNLGYLKFEATESSYRLTESFLVSLIKGSVSEICYRFLPSWEKNYDIFNNINHLTGIFQSNEKKLIKEYIFWEYNFLKNMGYELDLGICSVTGNAENIDFISPKTGNAVCYEVGKKYERKLFKIPKFLQYPNMNISKKECLNALNITGFFIEKFLEQNLKKLVYRKQLLIKIRNLEFF